MLVSYFTMRKGKQPKNAPSAEERNKAGIERFARFALPGHSLGCSAAINPAPDRSFQPTSRQLDCGGRHVCRRALVGRIPEAATAFLVPTTGYIVGLQLGQDPRNDFLSVLAFVYAVVLYASSRWSFAQFVEQHLSSTAVKQQAQLIGLLLRTSKKIPQTGCGRPTCCPDRNPARNHVGTEQFRAHGRGRRS